MGIAIARCKCGSIVAALVDYDAEETERFFMEHAGVGITLAKVDGEVVTDSCRCLEKAEAEIAALRAEVERLREAARPFAEAFARHGAEQYAGADDCMTKIHDQNQITPVVTMGDFRRLAAVLASPAAEKKGD